MYNNHSELTYRPFKGVYIVKERDTSTHLGEFPTLAAALDAMTQHEQEHGSASFVRFTIASTPKQEA